MRLNQVLRRLRGTPRLDAFGHPESRVNAQRRVAAAAAQRQHDLKSRYVAPRDPDAPLP
jgi:hypothetical protein